MATTWLQMGFACGKHAAYENFCMRVLLGKLKTCLDKLLSVLLRRPEEHLKKDVREIAL